MKFDDEVRDQAATWFAALRRGPMEVGERQAFDAWREDPVHQAALNSMHELWGELAAARPVFERTEEAPEPRRRWIPAAAAAALVAMLTAGGLYFALPNHAGPDHQLATAIGEQRTATMDDGSVITVNVATKLRYQVKASERTVDMGEGEAVFFVRKDKSRPFLVRTGDYEVRAVGTAFNVRNRDGQLDVAVLEGTVAVTALSGPRKGEEVARVTAGNKLSLGSAAALTKAPAPPTVEPAETIAEWRSRTLDYEDAPVSRVVEDLNLFFPRRIEVATPGLSERRVTIRLQVEDRERALTTLADILDVQVRRGNDSDTLAE